FKDLMRMEKHTFHALVRWLQRHTGLRGTQHQTVEQKVMVTVYTLGIGAHQRTTAHKFQISQSTVSQIMTSMLPRLMSLHKAFVRLPPDDWLDPDVELNPKTNAFNGCIGAVDGTHTAAHIPLRDQVRYRDRKGAITQNIWRMDLYSIGCVGCCSHGLLCALCCALETANLGNNSAI
ncbi:hypothetical protein B0H67DRAFT_493400, partial [Lasiosphaeris hirsuta]